jgi:hypothetical protein
MLGQLTSIAADDMKARDLRRGPHLPRDGTMSETPLPERAMGTALPARIPLVCSHGGRPAITGLPGPGFLRDGGLLAGEFGIELAGECVQALVGPFDSAVAQCPPGHGFPCCG